MDSRSQDDTPLKNLEKQMGAAFHNISNSLGSTLMSSQLLLQKIQNNQFFDKMQLIHGKLQDPNGIAPEKLAPYFSQLIKVINEERETVESLIKQIQTSTYHSKNIVQFNQHLISHKNFELANVSVLEVLTRIVPLYKQQTEQNGMTFIFDNQASHDSLQCQVKELFIEQILTNLIINAIDAVLLVSSQKSTVSLLVYNTAENNLFIEVQDNGIGMTQEILSQLFSFGRTSKKTGHGIGLYSCQQIACQQGWVLSAHSDGAGKGSCFKLQIL